MEEEKQDLQDIQQVIELEKFIRLHRKPLILAMASITLQQSAKFDKEDLEHLQEMSVKFDGDDIKLNRYKEFLLLSKAVARIYRSKSVKKIHIEIAEKSMTLLNDHTGERQ